MYKKQLFWPRFGGWIALNWTLAVMLWWLGYGPNIIGMLGLASITGGIAGTVHGATSALREKRARYYGIQLGTCETLAAIRRKAQSGEILGPAVKQLHPDAKKHAAPPTIRIAPYKKRRKPATAARTPQTKPASLRAVTLK